MYLPKFEKVTGKDELRESLMHVCISKEYTVATNAHVLVWSKIEWPQEFREFISKSEQVFILGDQWKKISNKEIVFIAVDKHSLVFKDKKKGSKIFVEYTTKATANFRYPQWKAVLPCELSGDIETTEIPAIGVNFSYLKDISDCLGHTDFRLDFFGQGRAILIRGIQRNPVNRSTVIPNKLTEEGAIVMPVML
jgi:hypothetical protein